MAGRVLSSVADLGTIAHIVETLRAEGQHTTHKRVWLAIKRRNLPTWRVGRVILARVSDFTDAV